MIQPTDLLVVQRDGTTCRAPAAELQGLLGRPACSATAGRLWDLNTTPADNDWRAVCWAPELNLLVAVSIDGSQRVMTSSDGIRWSSRTTPSDNNTWIAVCWSPERRLFVAVASSGSSNRVMTSSDGIPGRARRAGEQQLGGDLLEPGAAAVCGGGLWRQHQPGDDLARWHHLDRQETPPATLAGVCWAAELGLFVAVATSSNGTNQAVMTSRDGITWTLRNTPADNSWRSICWAAQLGLLVAVGQSGTR